MVPVVLSILVVVLISGAVLWVVAGDRDQPTSDKPSSAVVEVVQTEAPPPVARAVTGPALVATPRRPATSRRRPADVAAPTVAEPGPAVPMAAPTAPTAVPVAQAPLPRHPARSGVLLVLLIALIGVLLAIVIGAALAALALALRAAVTS